MNPEATPHKLQSKILVTGGHFTPAMAVISELQAKGYKHFVWVGHKFNQAGDKEPSAEYKSVTTRHIPFVDLKAGKLSRSWAKDEMVAGIINLLKIPWGFISSVYIMLKHKPDLILSFGGYLALPIVVVGKLFGKRIITHEQTAVTGLTNQLIPRFADKILIAWPSSAKYYPPEKTVLTGNPIRPEIFEARSDRFQFQNTLPILYVTGGNQGSHKINQVIFKALPDLLKFVNILHQTGSSTVTGDGQRAQQLKQQLPSELQSRYVPQSFFFADDIGEVFAKADIVLCRSGANSTYEILAVGIPSIFVPIPWVTHNEQQLNAEIAAQTGLATIISEKDLSTQKVIQTIINAITRIQEGRSFGERSLSEAKAAAKAIVRFDAAAAVARIVEESLTQA